MADFEIRTMRDADRWEVAELIYISINHWYQTHGQAAIFHGGPAVTDIFFHVYEALDPGCGIVARNAFAVQSASLGRIRRVARCPENGCRLQRSGTQRRKAQSHHPRFPLGLSLHGRTGFFGGCFPHSGRDQRRLVLFGQSDGDLNSATCRQAGAQAQPTDATETCSGHSHTLSARIYAGCMGCIGRRAQGTRM